MNNPQKKGMSIPKEANIYINTPISRPVYVHLETPDAYKEGDTPKFKFTQLFPKDTDLSEISKAVQTCIQVMKEHSPIWKTLPINEIKTPIKDGDRKYAELVAEKGEEAAQSFWQGHYYLVPTSQYKPDCYELVEKKNPDGTPVLGPNQKPVKEKTVIDPKKIYSGCYAQAYICVYPYKSGDTYGVTTRLQSVRFVANGLKINTGGSKGSEWDTAADEDLPAWVKNGMENVSNDNIPF
jgi:hypothetical protein